MLLLNINCVFDRAGRSFYNLNKFEINYKNNQTTKTITTQQEALRRWRHRRTLDLYHENWRNRCTFLCCCIKDNKKHGAFTNIAETFAIFFHKYDIVPTDILAGILLLRQGQLLKREEKKYFHHYSGVAITEHTQFFNLKSTSNLNKFKDLVYFFDYAVASYGWILFSYKSCLSCFKLWPNVKYWKPMSQCPCNHINTNLNSLICKSHSLDSLQLENDNSCFCYYSGLKKQLPNSNNIQVIYANFYSDISKPCYYVSVDKLKKKIVITIRGTESFSDSITDMQWKAVPMPSPVDESLEWYGHEGMVESALYILNELRTKSILNRAFNFAVS
jgi:sn1-specific diacylglycerol lipase